MSHLDAYKAPASASPFFSSKGDETPGQKSHILMSAVMPLNEVLHKKLSLRTFRRKYCTINDSAQTYDFSADKNCLLLSIIPKVLSGSGVITVEGKCIKS